MSATNSKAPFHPLNSNSNQAEHPHIAPFAAATCNTDQDATVYGRSMHADAGHFPELIRGEGSHSGIYNHPAQAEPLHQHLKTAAIVPAYNEAGRITNVLKVLANARLVDEIIVVTDGCDDSTADEAQGFAARFQRDEAQTGGCTSVRVMELEHNIGKGGAMTYGAHRTEAEVLLFLDADLIGLQSEHVDAMLQPMLHSDAAQRADMVLGLFSGARGGIVGWWLGVCHRRAAAITGQRAIRRDVFLAVPGLTRSRFGVETAITRYVKYGWKLKVHEVQIYGVTHPIKEEKIGLLRGSYHRFRMYTEIAGYIVFDSFRQQASTRHREQTLQMRQRFSHDNGVGDG